MTDTPEALAEKVRRGIWGDMREAREGETALDALLARLAEAEVQRDAWIRAATRNADDCIAAEADRDRYKAASLTAEEAQIVLIALDVVGEYGWDGAPSKILLASATAKLEEWAGDALAEIRPLRVVDDV